MGNTMHVNHQVYSKHLNISVIVIRGTDMFRANDLLDDVRIWYVVQLCTGLCGTNVVAPTHVFRVVQGGASAVQDAVSLSNCCNVGDTTL